MNASAADKQNLQALLMIQEQAKITGTIQMLTSKCWDTCVVGTPGSKMDSKTSTCVQNCVQRFLDSSNFIVNRLEREGAALAQQSQGLSSFD